MHGRWRDEGATKGLEEALSVFKQNPSVGYAASVSLRLGHAPALNVRRTFIHNRRAALLPYRGAHEVSSTPTNCAPIVLYEVSIFVLIVGCDAHIAPKKFNIIAFDAEKHLVPHAG